MKDRVIALVNQVIDLLKDFSSNESVAKIIELLKGFLKTEEKAAE